MQQKLNAKEKKEVSELAKREKKAVSEANKQTAV